MLTRIEIDGFKTFRNFAVDLPPFLVVLGRNASGKSNLFDAIQFVRLLSEGTVLDATQQMRGDVAELFHRHMDGSRVSRMRFAIEVLLPPTVVDAFGDIGQVTHSRMRYELELELRKTSRGDRPYVVRENARLIKKSDDKWIRRFPVKLRSNLVRYSGRTSVPLDTRLENGRSSFFLSQEGKQGRPRQIPAVEAAATVLSSLTTANEFPSLYALRRELQSWRLLQLDPVALRAPSSYDDVDTLASNGANLANVLRRIVDDSATSDRPRGALADIEADLAGVIPGVRALKVTEDEARRQRSIEVQMRDEAAFSARVASDGTLRAIALLAALYDGRDTGLICFEEPENGLFPRRLAGLLEHLRNRVDRAWDQRSSVDESPLPQLIFSSHSPAVLRALAPTRRPKQSDDIIFIDTVTRVEPSSPRSRVSRVRWIAPDRQPHLFQGGEPDAEEVVVGDLVSPAEIKEFEVTDMLEN